MSRSALLQYLELLKNSGIKELYQTQSDRAALLAELQDKYASCTKCQLHTGRIRFVYGEGNPYATAMVIGEGPGKEENLSGRPFVGQAGNLLDKMLIAINIHREDVYIANIVKCRPPVTETPK